MQRRRVNRRVKLTDRFVEAAKAPETGRLDFTDAQARGLVLRITAPTATHPKGLKSWTVRYRPRGGAQQRETIGAYPGISLADARQRALDVVAAASRGKDLPKEEAAERARLASLSRTVGDLLTEYVSDYCKANQRRWQQTERLLEMHIRPYLGDRRLVDVRRHDGAELMDKLQKAGLRAQVNRVRSQLVAAFNWAVEARGYLEANPMAAVKRRKGLETERGRVLSDDELRDVWRAADRIGGVPGGWVKSLILLGQRRDEVRCMARSEILPGTDNWVLPAIRNKGRRDHLVPLPPAVATIIAALHSDGRYVFSLDGKKPYSGHEGLKNRLVRESGVKDWTYHDFRRTCSSGMAALHVSQDTIDRVLNHAKGKLARTYNVYDYRAEKVAALKAWAERVAVIVSEGRRAPNVTELRPSA